jgi:universal protein Kae1
LKGLSSSRMLMGVILGIESTAHTFSIGGVSTSGDTIPSSSALFRPETGGIHPREAADHHSIISGEKFKQFISENNLDLNQIDAIAYSQGPGLGPCLRVGASVARSLSEKLTIPLIGVNHCVAHIEIGRLQTGCKDPVLLYVSGGNTQVIARKGGRYRVIGETLDIGIGNMLDKFARTQGIPFPGGPKIEQLALEWERQNEKTSLDNIMLPYSVQGMDLSFSGILTAAIQKINDGHPLEEVCWSLQEHSFSSCIEVAERALAHTGKKELLLGGGVACNERIRTMSELMCNDRGAVAYWPEKQYCVDNGTMIAELGRKMLKHDLITKLEDSAIDPSMRTDHAEVVWE